MKTITQLSALATITLLALPAFAMDKTTQHSHDYDSKYYDGTKADMTTDTPARNHNHDQLNTSMPLHHDAETKRPGTRYNGIQGDLKMKQYNN